MSVPYDEFGMFADNASEVGLPYDGPPDVRREVVEVTDDGRTVSALVWGPGEPELVLLHGGAQNAHTWDTVALALGRPLVAVDLPGHGHSDWKDDHAYWPPLMAEDVATVVRALAPGAELVVGMSLGGMTAFCLAANHPLLVKKLAIVDVTPGVNHQKAEPILSFVTGPESFASFDEILDRTIQFNPTRTETSLRRGVLHNARELPDGSWTWRYDVMRDWAMQPGADLDDPMPAFDSLWDAVEAVECPLLLLRGGDSGVVGDEDVAELLRRQPEAEVVVVDGAGHSIQGDQPVELARLLEEFLAR